MGKKWKQWQILFSSAPKSLQTVTAATKLKTLLGRKAMTNLGSVSKNRDLLLPTKLCTVKALVFSVVMHRCEIWTIKKADTFKLWGWGRLLGVPWTAEIKPEPDLPGSFPLGARKVTPFTSPLGTCVCCVPVREKWTHVCHLFARYQNGLSENGLVYLSDWVPLLYT